MSEVVSDDGNRQRRNRLRAGLFGAYVSLLALTGGITGCSTIANRSHGEDPVLYQAQEKHALQLRAEAGKFANTLAQKLSNRLKSPEPNDYVGTDSLNYKNKTYNIRDRIVRNVGTRVINNNAGRYSLIGNSNPSTGEFNPHNFDSILLYMDTGEVSTTPETVVIDDQTDTLYQLQITRIPNIDGTSDWQFQEDYITASGDAIQNAFITNLTGSSVTMNQLKALEQRVETIYSWSETDTPVDYIAEH